MAELRKNKSCDTCGKELQCRDNLGEFGQGDCLEWKSKPSPVLGETVLDSLKLLEIIRPIIHIPLHVFKELVRYAEDREIELCGEIEVAKQQDAYTRRKLIEQGWKSQGEVRAINNFHLGFVKMLLAEMLDSYTYQQYKWTSQLTHHIKELEANDAK